MKSDALLPAKIATAGWGIPREHANEQQVGTGLQKYASVWSATEINSTFYRRHRSSTFERWRESVPESFLFAVKMPRSITHEAALASPRPALEEFFLELRPLSAKLGPVLVQLPASVQFEVRRAGAFFRALRSLYKGPVACEPRHASWYTERASSVLLANDVARVVADPPRPEAASLPGGATSLRYVRWHGSPNIYRSSYSDERLAWLVDFVIAQPSGTNTWCVFDNTASGAAFTDALRFRDLLRRKLSERDPR